MNALVRPARPEDLPTLLAFAQEASVGFTSLPPDREVLIQKIEASQEAFKTATPNHDSYLFCLEQEGRVVGTCALISRIGEEPPFHAYHLLYEKQQFAPLSIDREIPVLHLIEARTKPTEIATLYLDKAHRGQGLGRLLSFARFLFLACFPERFASVVIAELRGFIDAQQTSPFWEAVGRPFFGLSFSQADKLRATSPEAIDALFPKHPIYPMLLPKEAHAAVGRPHPLTKPAMHLLREQGFSLSDYYDIFDGGPHLYAPTHEIRAVAQSRTAPVGEIRAGAIHSRDVLISNTQLDFRVCRATIEGDEALILSEETASALNVQIGDTVRYLCL